MKQLRIMFLLGILIAFPTLAHTSFRSLQTPTASAAGCTTADFHAAHLEGKDMHFMHRCRYGRVAPSTHATFWRKKRLGNVARDRRGVVELRKAGWTVLTIWECWTRTPAKLANRLDAFLKEPQLLWRVYINDGQYFEGVPEEVWEFHIGGYQVCEKWLKDRKGRKLSSDHIDHYQKIVVALAETIRIMAEIDSIIPGWPLP